MRSLILRFVARAILPVTLLFALHLLARGHDEPGGGFVAGLVTSAGLVLQALAFRRPWTRTLAGRMAGAGVSIAMLVALIAPLRGAPLLTHAHDLLPEGWPKLSTTFLFDVGVFAAVTGTVATVLAAFEERTR